MLKLLIKSYLKIKVCSIKSFDFITILMNEACENGSIQLITTRLNKRELTRCNSIESISRRKSFCFAFTQYIKETCIITTRQKTMYFRGPFIFQLVRKFGESDLLSHDSAS
jgi:hypothetical protein